MCVLLTLLCWCFSIYNKFVSPTESSDEEMSPGDARGHDGSGRRYVRYDSRDSWRHERDMRDSRDTRARDTRDRRHPDNRHGGGRGGGYHHRRNGKHFKKRRGNYNPYDRK